MWGLVFLAVVTVLTLWLILQWAKFIKDSDDELEG